MQVFQRDQQASVSQADASAGQPRRNANAHNANPRNRQQRGFANAAGRTTPSTVREQGPAAKRRKVSHETGDAISTEEWNARLANALAVVWQAIPTKMTTSLCVLTCAMLRPMPVSLLPRRTQISTSRRRFKREHLERTTRENI